MAATLTLMVVHPCSSTAWRASAAASWAETAGMIALTGTISRRGSGQVPNAASTAEVSQSAHPRGA